MKNQKLSLFFVLIIIIVVAILMAVYYNSNDSYTTEETTPKSKNNEAENIQNLIAQKRQNIIRIKAEITLLNNEKEIITNNAKRAFLWFKIHLLIFVVATWCLIYFSFGLEIWQTVVSFIGICCTLMTTYLIIAKNRLSDFNRILLLTETAFIQSAFKKHGFELALIDALELKLSTENNKLFFLECRLEEINSKELINA